MYAKNYKALVSPKGQLPAFSIQNRQMHLHLIVIHRVRVPSFQKFQLSSFATVWRFAPIGTLAFPDPHHPPSTMTMQRLMMVSK